LEKKRIFAIFLHFFLLFVVAKRATSRLQHKQDNEHARIDVHREAPRRATRKERARQRERKKLIFFLFFFSLFFLFDTSADRARGKQRRRDEVGRTGKNNEGNHRLCFVRMGRCEAQNRVLTTRGEVR
jgi:hypothetical protein